MTFQRPFVPALPIICFTLAVVQNVHLFNGVSQDSLLQLVPEMEVEYFPPKEDVLLQNEAPTDAYILVSGAVDFIMKINGHNQIVGKAFAGDIFGEIGVLCGTPQSFGVQTTETSQILRLNKTTFLNILQASPEDERIVMNNLFLKLKLYRGFNVEGQQDPTLILENWFDKDHTGDQDIFQRNTETRNWYRNSKFKIYDNKPNRE